MQFLLNSRRTFWTPLPGFNFQVQAMKLSDFQKNAPIRGKRNTEGALDLLVNERRIEIRPYPYNSGNGVRTVSLIIINHSVQNHQPNILNALYNGNHIWGSGLSLLSGGEKTMGTAKRKVYDAHSRVKWDWRRSGEQKPSTRLRRSMVYTRHSLGNGRRLSKNRSAPCLRILWHTADRCL